jgi:nitrous oxidase accessory protein NosD
VVAPPASPTPPPPAAPPPPPPPEFSRILWVSPGGSDAAEGSKERPFRTVAKALSQVRPGEAVFLQSGTYAERLRLDERGGVAGSLLTIEAAPGATPVFKGGTGSSTPMIDVRGAYWRVEGLTVDVAGDKAFAVLWRGKGAHHGILRRCVLKNGTEGAGVDIYNFASDVLVENNQIHHFQKAGGGDSHGVCVETTARNVVVRGNDIHHNSGDGVQCLGPEGGATEPGTPFDNLLVEDNELHENQENGADIKTCTRVTLRRNSIWGHHRTATSAGEGVVVHLSARDVTLEDNEFHGNGRGINIGGIRVGAPPTHVILRRNLVLDGDAKDGNDGVGIRVDTSSDVKLQNNTVWNMPGSCVMFGYGDTGPSQGLEVRNNVLAGCTLSLRAGAGRAGAVVDSNLYFRDGGAARFRLDGVDQDLTQWRQKTGLDGRSLERSPGFTDTDAEDFTLTPASPARDRGVALGLPFCGSAPDLGARESGCP